MTHTSIKTLRDSAGMRWTALLLLALAMFCAYIFMDILSPIKDLMESTRGWDSKAFGTMQGAETFLNVFVFFLIFAGIILDKMGVRFTAVLSGAVMLTGGLIKFYAVSEYFMGSGLETWFTNHLNYIPGFDELDVSPFYGEKWKVIKEGATNPTVINALKFDESTMTFVKVVSRMPASAKLAAIGFMIFGCGAEMAGITVSRGIVKWFKGRETALAMGSEMALARLGVATCMIFSPYFAKLGGEVHVDNSVKFGVVLLCIALIMFVTYFFMDKKLDSQTGEAEEKDEPFKIKDIGKILSSLGFWLVALLCVLYYSAIFPFQKYAVNMLQCNLTLQEPVIMNGTATFDDFGQPVNTSDPQTLVVTDSMMTAEAAPAVANNQLLVTYGDSVLALDMPNLNAENNTVNYELDASNSMMLVNGKDTINVKLAGKTVESGDTLTLTYGQQVVSAPVEGNFWAGNLVTIIQYFVMLIVAACSFASNFIKTNKPLKYGLMCIAVLALVVYCYMGFMRGTAETIFAVFPLLAVAITPILGSYVDHKGKAASMLMIGSILLVICHLTFAFILPMCSGSAVGGTIVAYVTILVLGASFSLVPAALWPSVPKLVDEKIIGSAYALIFWIQNIGLWLFPLLIGNVLEKTNANNQAVIDAKEAIEAGASGVLVPYNYQWALVMLAALGLAALLIGIYLKAVDKKKHLGLEEPNIK